MIIYCVVLSGLPGRVRGFPGPAVFSPQWYQVPGCHLRVGPSTLWLLCTLCPEVSGQRKKPNRWTGPRGAGWDTVPSRCLWHVHQWSVSGEGLEYGSHASTFYCVRYVSSGADMGKDFGGLSGHCFLGQSLMCDPYILAHSPCVFKAMYNVDVPIEHVRPAAVHYLFMYERAITHLPFLRATTHWEDKMNLK